MVAGRKMCWEQIYFKGSSSNNCSKQPTSLLYKFFSTVFGIVEMIKIFFQTPITLAKSDTVLFVEILDLGISEDELANQRIKEAWIRPARRKSHQSQSVRHTSSNSYLEGKSSCTWYSLLYFDYFCLSVFTTSWEPFSCHLLSAKPGNWEFVYSLPL